MFDDKIFACSVYSNRKAKCYPIIKIEKGS